MSDLMSSDIRQLSVELGINVQYIHFYVLNMNIRHFYLIKRILRSSQDWVNQDFRFVKEIKYEIKHNSTTKQEMY